MKKAVDCPPGMQRVNRKSNPYCRSLPKGKKVGKKVVVASSLIDKAKRVVMDAYNRSSVGKKKMGQVDEYTNSISILYQDNVRRLLLEVSLDTRDEIFVNLEFKMHLIFGEIEKLHAIDFISTIGDDKLVKRDIYYDSFVLQYRTSDINDLSLIDDFLKLYEYSIYEFYYYIYHSSNDIETGRRTIPANSLQKAINIMQLWIFEQYPDDPHRFKVVNIDDQRVPDEKYIEFKWLKAF